jgi:hypothetical protein
MTSSNALKCVVSDYEKGKTQDGKATRRYETRYTSHVAINDNVYFISEQDCLEYDNLCVHPDNWADDESVAWCDKMIKKYKPQYFLDIIVRND